MTEPAPVMTSTDRDAVERMAALPPQSPWRVFWRQFRRSQLAVAGGVILGVFYAVAIMAPFVAPYAQESMDRERFFHPPHRLHWIDASGRFHPIPFIHPTRLADAGDMSY